MTLLTCSSRIAVYRAAVIPCQIETYKQLCVLQHLFPKQTEIEQKKKLLLILKVKTPANKCIKRFK